MTRECCVLQCRSGKNVLLHKFPKNVERRNKWFENLHIKPLQNDKEIRKLRVCYKHFSDNAYSGSSNKKVLLHFAVPSHMPQHISVDNNDKHQEEEILKEQNCIILPQEQNQEVLIASEPIEVMDVNCDNQEIQDKEVLTQQEIEFNNVVSDNNHQEQENQKILAPQSIQFTNIDCEKHERFYKQFENIQKQQERLIQQQHEILMQHDTKIASIQKTLSEQNVQIIARPDLLEVTRKNKLSPKAKQMYNKIIKLKKDNRRLKRLTHVARKQRKSKVITVQLDKKDYKGNIDKTVHIRQNFINMIIKNNNVAPQIQLQS